MSCLGSFRGLRCVTRARAHEGRAKALWLSLAAVAIGACEVWVMHFIAMLGFTIPKQSITYNVPVTIASMLIAIAVVGAGLFIVGYGDGSVRRLAVGGLIVGVGVASMHYLGMAAMIMPDTMSYNPVLLAPSLVIAVVAGTPVAFLFPMLIGISVLTLVTTLTITMSPSEEEIREDLAMKERMELLQRRAASGEPRPRQRSGGIHW